MLVALGLYSFSRMTSILNLVTMLLPGLFPPHHVTLSNQAFQFSRKGLYHHFDLHGLQNSHPAPWLGVCTLFLLALGSIYVGTWSLLPSCSLRCPQIIKTHLPLYWHQMNVTLDSKCSFIFSQFRRN